MKFQWLSSGRFLYVVEKTFSAVMIALISGIVLSFTDIYLCYLYAEMSPNTYLVYLIAYIVLSLVVIIPVRFYISFFSKSEEFPRTFNFIYFSALVFIVEFVLVNWNFFGGFDIFDISEIVRYFLNLKVVVYNAILLAGFFFWVYLAKRKKKVYRIFKNTGDVISLAIYTFGFLSLFNFFFMNWWTIPHSVVKISVMTLLIVFIQFFSTAIKVVIDEIIGNGMDKKRIAAVIAPVIIILIIPSIIGFPLLNFYYNAPYQPDKTQLKRMAPKPNIIWIVIDTARKDHLSCYGYQRKTTPHIDEFAKDGVMFNKYISTAPWTLPAHASMFTGMYSSRHGAYHANDAKKLGYPLSEEHVTLAEILKENGFNTASIVANGVLSRGNNFDQGFNFYYDDRSHFNNFFWGKISKTSGFFNAWIDRPFFKINRFLLSSEINELVFRWLSGHSKDPFFLFINYMEPHFGAFYLPEPFSSMFHFDRKNWQPIDIKKITHFEAEVNPEQQQLRYDWLDCKMAFMDYHIGKLFRKLKRLNIYDDAFIILVSDHGELYGEHRSFGHHTELYDELLNVPLIIKYPRDMQKYGVNNQYVQTVDLMPELLQVLDIPIPDWVQGQPIDRIDHEIIAELFRNKRISKINPVRYNRDVKVIYDIDEELKYHQSTNNMNALYNLKIDPGESYNISEMFPEKTQLLDERLNRWTQSFKKFDNKKIRRGHNLNKDIQQRLKTLGYIK